MLKCYDCGEVFTESAIAVGRECVGDFWGAPAYQNEEYCPYCGSDDFEEYNEEEEDIDEDTKLEQSGMRIIEVKEKFNG